jgi:hypothetical protein
MLLVYGEGKIEEVIERELGKTARIIFWKILKFILR